MQSPIITSPLNQQNFQQHPQHGYFQVQNQNPTNSNNNNSISGPPINSLFDSLRNERSFQTPTKSFYHQSQNVNQQDTPIQLNNSGFNQSRIMSPIPNTMSDFNNSNQNPMYPNALSFTNQSMNGYNKLHQQDFWITVFGFPSESTSIVLSHFSGCGTILDKVCSSGNWIHLKYSSRGECDKALLYNGKIIGNNLMIGVTRCNDESVMEKENSEYPVASISRIRSLTGAAYKTSDTAVLNQTDEPKKTSGIVNKAMDLIFGW